VDVFFFQKKKQKSVCSASLNVLGCELSAKRNYGDLGAGPQKKKCVCGIKILVFVESEFAVWLRFFGKISFDVNKVRVCCLMLRIKN
jgi:hypothetical protein